MKKFSNWSEEQRQLETILGLTGDMELSSRLKNGDIGVFHVTVFWEHVCFCRSGLDEYLNVKISFRSVVL
jgi:hypothetical protein